jgi:type 2 lantibiotic biosynthesis protein LanM
VDAFHARLLERAATIDELLSDAFETPPGEGGGDADLAARRLAAWSHSAANGDQALFARRLVRDRLSIEEVRRRFAAARPNPAAPMPAWFDDAAWIEKALQGESDNAASSAAGTERVPCAFEQVLVALADAAEARLWSDVHARMRDHFTESALLDLRRALIGELSALCAAALYERFSKARAEGYARFVAAMRNGGWRRLFEDKPVLLRLMATLVRHWIDTTREFIVRLDADLPMIRRDILNPTDAARVSGIEGELSDPHNGGRAVKILRFEDGARIVYKPKDLRLDAAWHALVDRLNAASPPIDLKAARALPRDGYGWTEFIEHTGCAAEEGAGRYFYRAGAWLALFHCFVASDMHQENVIADGEHPVPIDLETILQATADEHKTQNAEGAAFDAAMDVIGDSVMTVGLLPAYGRGAFNDVFAMGGLTADWGSRTVVRWDDINSDAMRPAKAKEIDDTNPNLPHVGGRYARLSGHIESFIAGFADYAKFLSGLRDDDAKPEMLFGGFAGLPVRKVIHPTRFYYMLLQRLKNHRTMEDGAIWSAQADFVARLSNWERDADPLWPLLRAERTALLALDVPHFISPSDGNEVRDAAGIAARMQSVSGLERARERFRRFDEREIAWQIEVIRANTNSAMPAKPALAAEPAPPIVPTPSADEMFVAEAGRIATELSRYAIRRGPGAAWIGLDWLGDADVFQLVCLGPDLYNGAPGIALFLAAHAKATGCEPSGELAVAALAHLRATLKDRNAARLARALGLGAATGLGSVVYALAVIAKCLDRADLLADALGATRLFTDDLIAADRQFDVVGGSAGAILALLRIYRDTQSAEVLARAARCGEHLLAQGRLGEEGRRSWIGQGFGQRALNGMSHGASGFAYALASLAAATGRDEFARAAGECIAFEDASYDAERHNWPDLRGSGEPHWPCQWCHGAPGIGLARLAMVKRAGASSATKKQMLTGDIRNALTGVEHGRLTPVDTLCCGSLGCVEFFCEAAAADDGATGSGLRELASQRLVAVLQRAQTAGDYRWNNGERRFNLGLFRGLAGVGYTLLRQAFARDDRIALPNVLIWE